MHNKGLTSFIVLLFIALFFLCSLFNSLKKFHGNYSGLLRISTLFAAQNPFLKHNPALYKTLLLASDTGYDGQLYYFIAFDPLLHQFADQPEQYQKVVDAVPYRYSRIIYPLLTNLLSNGNPYLFPQVMIWILLFSLIAGAFFFNRILVFHNIHPAWTLLYGIVPSFIFALTYGTPEPLAAMALLAGLFFYNTRRFWISALFLSAAILTRETSIIAILCVAIFEMKTQKNRRGAGILLMALIPFIAWRIFLTYRLWDLYGWHSLYYSAGNVGLPLKGIIDLYSTIFAGQYLRYIIPAGILLPIFIALIVVIATRIFWRRRNLYALIGSLYAVLLLCATYDKIWIHVANAERTCFEAFLMFFLAVLSSESFKSRNYYRYAFTAILFLYCAVLSTAHQSFRFGLMPWRLFN